MTVVASDVPLVRSRTAWLPPVLISLLVALVAQWATAPYVVGVFHDDGIYALLARSIASGQGFHYAHLPGAPAATHYPPLYPLLLGAVWRLAPDFPGNLSVLLSLNAVLIAMAAVGAWRFAGTRLGWSPSWCLTAAVATSLTSPTLALSGALLSESLFIALLWPALIAGERVIESRDPVRLVTAALLVGMLMLVRTHGVALMAAVVLLLVARGRWKVALAFAAITEGVQVPWQLWSHWATPRLAGPLEGAYGSYIGWFVDGLRDGGATFVLATARVNAIECWMLLRDRVALGPSDAVVTIAALLLLVGIICGAWSLVEKARVTIAFLLCYIGILLVWPYAPWRFLWCVWPLVLVLAFEGARTLWARPGHRRIGVALGAALPVLAVMRTELHAYANREWRAPARRASAQIAPVVQWVRTHTTAADVVLSEGEQIVSLYTGRRAAPPVSFTAREYISTPGADGGGTRLGAMLSAVPSRYALIVTPQVMHDADALANAHPGLKRIDTVRDVAVYEVVP